MKRTKPGCLIYCCWWWWW